MLLSGIHPPITTSFYPDGNIYFKKLEANVERYSRTPVAEPSKPPRLPVSIRQSRPPAW